MPAVDTQQIDDGRMSKHVAVASDDSNKMVQILLAAIGGTAVQLCLLVRTAQAGGHHGPNRVVTVIRVQ